MGNESCSFPRISNRDLALPQLKERNSYGTTLKQNDEKLLRSIFTQSYQDNRNSKLPQLIIEHAQQIFVDNNFKLDEKESLRLSVLFNFQANKIRIYTKKEPTDITSFIQLNIEYSYLTSVFFLLCRQSAKTRLLPRLLQTQETNPYGAYSAQLFCNGEPHQVIIDDRMPTHKDSFLYLRVVKGIELWPLLLEKAWCKQIGSYERAKGLSPEDAFEQITGIPAYTYTIKTNNHNFIKTIMNSAITKGYWVALIARNGLTDLQNKQVFHIESIEMDEYRIMSPYVSFNFERYPQKRRGEVVVKEEDIFSHFEHVIVGFYKDNYLPISLPVTSTPRQEMLFELNLKNKEEVSIRFNQPYKGYFSTNDRSNYEYSPVLLQLYEVSEEGTPKKFKLVNYCQGCNRALSGARSSQCSLNIMELLGGKYIVRLQVGWLIDGLINTGNLVVYASQGNATLTPLRNPELLFKEIYPDIFTHEPTTKIILHEHNLEVNTFDKEKSTLIMFHNVTNEIHHFQADFSTSKNILLRGKEVKDTYAYIRLQPDQKTIIEVLPKDLKKNLEIQNFQINKLTVKP